MCVNPIVSLALLILLPNLLTQGVNSYRHAARVIELSDRFMEVRHEGVWLVKFYAPWCGHCKKLEPIFNHVAQALHDSPIRVAKVDCTRFTTVAQEYKIQGYPTILLIKGEEVHMYRGDRTAEEIVQYAKRMIGSPIQNLDGQSLQSVFEKEKLLFGYVGDKEGELWDAFNQTAVAYQAYNQFFYLDQSEVPSDFLEKKGLPFVFVRKENEEYFYNIPEGSSESSEYNLTISLSEWVIRERFPTFMRITRANFQELTGTNKYIVVAVVDEDKLGRLTPEMATFKSLVESIILRNKDVYNHHFQFGWVGHPDLANSVAMATLPVPSLIVVNTTSFHHYIPEDEPQHLTHDAIASFLDQIKVGTAPAYGGRSILMRAYRAYYEAKTSLADMWVGNPILTTILFGLPLGFLSLIFYSICCADIMDSSNEEEDETSQEAHEKRE